MATAEKKGSAAQSSQAPKSRGDVIQEILAETGTDSHERGRAEQIVKAYEAAIERTLSTGGEVRLSGFGTFKTSHRAARMARNPQTGEAVPVQERTVPRFTPSKVFKDAIAEATQKTRAASAKGAAKGAAKGGAKGAAAKGGGAKGAAPKAAAAKGAAAKSDGAKAAAPAKAAPAKSTRKK